MVESRKLFLQALLVNHLEEGGGKVELNLSRWTATLSVSGTRENEWKGRKEGFDEIEKSCCHRLQPSVSRNLVT